MLTRTLQIQTTSGQYSTWSSHLLLSCVCSALYIAIVFFFIYLPSFRRKLLPEVNGRGFVSFLRCQKPEGIEDLLGSFMARSLKKFRVCEVSLSPETWRNWGFVRFPFCQKSERFSLWGSFIARNLKELEDRILSTLSSSQGSILEDETAIIVLSDAKRLVTETQEKQAIADQTENKVTAQLSQ